MDRFSSFLLAQPSGERLHNSWYIKISHRHHYYCRCGQVDVVSDVGTQMHHPLHCCSACGGGRYLDAVVFVTDESVRYWSPFVWYLTSEEDTEGWHVSVRVNVPLWDVRQQAVRIHALSVLGMSLKRMGSLEDHTILPIIARKHILSEGYDRTLQVKTTMHKKMLPKLRQWFLRRMPTSLHWLRSRNLSPVVS